jgi:hypothetical protein
MSRNRWLSGAIIGLATLWLLLSASVAPAQSPASRTTPGTQSAVDHSSPLSDKELGETQEQLIQLLRVSPTLARTVANDPSLLADQEYVSRRSPELEKFLESHPEIVRNPDFYLFAQLRRPDGRAHLALMEPSQFANRQMINFLQPFLVFACCLVALLWISRVLLENRRWSRLFKAQTDIYNKLLDKFSSNEDLLAYVRGDAGKRFFESLSLPPVSQSPIGSPLGRVLIPLQRGVILTLAGAGLIAIRGSVPEGGWLLLVVGTTALMLGIGFVVSAGLSMILARHLGLLEQNPPAAPQASMDTKNNL